MANFVFNYDSVSKKLTVSKDGSELTDVRDIMFYNQGGDRFEMGICQRTKNDADGTVTYVQTMAGEQAAAGVGTPKTEEDIEVVRAAVREQMKSYFGGSND
jgi:hypothetical protein